MKILIRWVNNRAFLAILLVSGFMTDAILIGQAYKFNRTDWGTWVGALGTVGALLGTIWLAYGETRRREHRELLIAELHAEEMLVQVISLRASACALYDGALGVPVAQQNPQILNWCIDHVRKLEAWKVEDLLPLTAMSTNVAVNMARAAGTLKLIQLAHAEGMIESDVETAELMQNLRALLLKFDSYLEKAEIQLKTGRKIVPYTLQVA